MSGYKKVSSADIFSIYKRLSQGGVVTLYPSDIADICNALESVMGRVERLEELFGKDRIGRKNRDVANE